MKLREGVCNWQLLDQTSGPHLELLAKIWRMRCAAAQLLAAIVGVVCTELLTGRVMASLISWTRRTMKPAIYILAKTHRPCMNKLNSQLPPLDPQNASIKTCILVSVSWSVRWLSRPQLRPKPPIRSAQPSERAVVWRAAAQWPRRQQRPPLPLALRWCAGPAATSAVAQPIGSSCLRSKCLVSAGHLMAVPDFKPSDHCTGHTRMPHMPSCRRTGRLQRIRIKSRASSIRRIAIL